MTLSTEENMFAFLRLNIFTKLNTGNQVADMMISSMVMIYMPVILMRFKSMFMAIYNNIIYYRSNKLTLEGIHCVMQAYGRCNSQNIFSVRFRALWDYIQQYQHDTIYSIKEYPSCGEGGDSDDEDNDQNNNNNDGDVNKKRNNDIFIVNQHTPFKLDDDIMCKVICVKEDFDKKQNGDKNTGNVEYITIELYSRVKTINELQIYIDTIMNNYIEDLYKSRYNQQFIYTLTGFKDKPSAGVVSPIWDECKFRSSRKFDTLFFDNKIELIEKLDFFENNKEWYDKEGHPYTMGIALHGPPGTGKTSIIKCIANHLNRHLIVIPLSKIRTQSQFNKCFFDKEYNHKNAKHEIDFDNKIIVFEDIDCMSDIIMERKKKQKDENNKSGGKNEILEAINKVMSKKDECDANIINLIDRKNSDNDEITLSFILNVIDGIRETPGRIMIITSNQYELLDPAFTRPGRIDLSMEMKNASVPIIEEIVKHFYNATIPDTIQKKLKDGIISPAALINTRFNAKNVDEFLNIIVKDYM